MKKILALTLVASLSCISTIAQAKQLNAEFPASDLSRLEIQNGVGEVRIEQSNDANISVEIDVKAAKKWFFNRAKVEEAELQSNINNGRLTLTVPTDDTEQQWLVKIPKGMALDLELGVGEIDVQAEASDIDAEIGVGSFKADVELAQYGSVDMSAGVGDVRLKTKAPVDASRHLVGGDLQYQGAGQAKINVEIGVGDAVVRDLVH